MTESEWLNSNDPLRMLNWLTNPVGPINPRIHPSDRKLRLFACAICRQYWHGISPGSREAVRILERVVDGELPESLAWPGWVQLREGDSAHLAADVLRRYVLGSGSDPDKAAILRDIVGNPFKIYAWTDIHDCSPSGHNLQFLDRAWLRWNSGTVPALAQQIYDERAFDLMPQLGDALEDAGCTDGDILNHCRGSERPGSPHYRCKQCGVVFRRIHKYSDCDSPGCDGEDCEMVDWIPLRSPHVRGCWVLDLILGRE